MVRGLLFRTGLYGSLIFGVLLMLINLYGLSQNLRPDNIELEHLRFKEHDVSLSQQEFFKQSQKYSDETELEYAARLTQVIAGGLAHIHWEEYTPAKFNQTVPIWENYILYLMGKFKVMPEYVRYHFSDPEKSIERGIGICGDASILMSQLLQQHGIDNKIITIPGHVMVEANFDGNKKVYDPDFGVTLGQSAAYYKSTPLAVGTAYSDNGYTLGDDKFIIDGFKSKLNYWDGVKHFITKKYYFEKAAYVLKWLIPLVFLLLGAIFWRQRKS